MGAKINIYKGKKSEFRFNITAANNKKIATPGEGFKTHAGVNKAVGTLKRYMPGSKVVDKTIKK